MLSSLKREWFMANDTSQRVLGRLLARDLTEREAESVGGGHSGGCTSITFTTGYSTENGAPICDAIVAEFP